MSASKLKNLVILILVLANIFLLALAIPAQRNERERRETADRELAELFEGAGVTLPDAGIPETAPLYPQEAACRPTDNLAAVTAVLGQQVVARESAYRTEFRSAAGEASLTADGTFRASLRDRNVAQDPELEARELLRQMGGAWSALRRTESGETLQLSASQQLDGVSVLSHEMLFTYRDGVLTNVSGRLAALSAARKTRDTACCTARDALIAFLSSRLSLGWVGSRILSIEQGYALADAAAPSTVQLIPMWQIVTDTGAYRVDGVARTVTATDGAT